MGKFVMFKITILIPLLTFALADKLVFHASDFPTLCLTKAVESNYVPEGRELTFGDLTVYETRDTTPKKLLFAAYDIFGFHPNTKRVIDRIAEGGFRVVLPDFLRGGWDINVEPSASPVVFENFLATNGSWDNAKIDLQNLLAHYKGQGVTWFGSFGFCWGGAISLMASKELDDIMATGLIHSSQIRTTEANEIKHPAYILPSRDEPDFIPFYNIVAERFGAENCGHRRFDDMYHGFASSHANFEDPLIRQRIEEVIQILQVYFNEQSTKSQTKIGWSFE